MILYKLSLIAYTYAPDPLPVASNTRTAMAVAFLATPYVWPIMVPTVYVSVHMQAKFNVHVSLYRFDNIIMIT